MDIPFKPIRLEDKEIITSFTFPSDYRNCDFSFANMCSWRFLYDSEFAIVDGYLLIRFMIEDKSRFAYMMPVGSGDLTGAVRLLEEDSLKYGHPLCMLGITPDAKEQLESALPGSFFYIPERDYFDYIYLREDLATLRGKKYQSKRNHINNFKKQYSYEYVPITPDIVPQCLKLECKWYKANNGDNDEEELNDERRSLTYALHYFDSLGPVSYTHLDVYKRQADIDTSTSVHTRRTLHHSYIPSMVGQIRRQGFSTFPKTNNNRIVLFHL